MSGIIRLPEELKDFISEKTASQTENSCQDITVMAFLVFSDYTTTADSFYEQKFYTRNQSDEEYENQGLYPFPRKLKIRSLPLKSYYHRRNFKI